MCAGFVFVVAVALWRRFTRLKFHTHTHAHTRCVRNAAPRARHMELEFLQAIIEADQRARADRALCLISLSLMERVRARGGYCIVYCGVLKRGMCDARVGRSVKCHTRGARSISSAPYAAIFMSGFSRRLTPAHSWRTSGFDRMAREQTLISHWVVIRIDAVEIFR